VRDVEVAAQFAGPASVRAAEPYVSFYRRLYKSPTSR